MFVLYAFLAMICFLGSNLICLKLFQLEGYKIKNYIKKILKFEFAFGTKNKLILTNRAKRLIFSCFFLNFSCFLLIFCFLKPILVLLLTLFLLLILSPVMIVFVFLFNLPIENLIKQNYIKKAKEKLKKVGCKKIAITGSFGKTSTKNILYQILKEEFDVCATPKSFNTPMGVCKTILNDLKPTDDFFVVEFGARHSGDIEYLSKMIGVDFAIMTPIGGCHLETFGSLENIENAKYELCENVSDFVVFNGKSSSTKNLFNRYPQKKYLVCEEKSFAYAKNIESNCDGSQFTLILDGHVFNCKTKLLGKANIDNIVVASAMAYLLGESLYSINNAISKIKPTPHRLELIKGPYVDVIDDSYNSNFDGFVQALEVLCSFKVGKKVVVSPGIVELGKKQKETNFDIGKEVGKVADVFVIMNKTNKKELFDGALQAGMSEGQIFFAENREQQKLLLKRILSKGDVVLFENDLPDNFR